MTSKSASRISALIFLLGLTVLESACSSHSNPEGLREKGFFDIFSGMDDYSKTFNKHTVRRRIYSEFEPVMTIFVTNWNLEMRDIFTRQVSLSYRHTVEQENAALKKEVEEAKVYIGFVVSAETREPTWNSFGKTNALWNFSLETEDGKTRLGPDAIELISDRDEVTKYFFPVMNAFSKSYRVRFKRSDFPLATTDQKVKLYVTGARGNTHIEYSAEDLDLKMKDAPPPAAQTPAPAVEAAP